MLEKRLEINKSIPLGDDASSLGNWILTFQSNVVSLSSGSVDPIT
jgi:hypothetical protein